MLIVNNLCCVDLSFDGFPGLVRQNFIGVIVVEDGRGLVVPAAEIMLRQMDRSLYPYVSKKGLKITLTYGTNPETANTYEFSLVNHIYESAEGGGFKLTLSCLLDVSDFTNKASIQSFDGTSDDVLSQLGSVTPVIDYKGDDKQFWIRHNNSEKNFAERVLKHAYISDDDMVVGALTVGKQLVVRSVKDAFESEPVVKFTDITSPGNLKVANFNTYSSQSDNAIWSKFLAEGRTLTVTKRDNRESVILYPATGGVINKGSTLDMEENVGFPPVLDNLNCHDKYWQAWLNNLSRSVEWLSHNVVLSTMYRFFSNDDLKLLDVVDFQPSNPGNDDYVSSLAGKYMAIYKVSSISQKGSMNKFYLGRDSLVQ